MATSGTVGTTKFNLAQIIDHALRRCKLNPSIQTAELVDTARSALYLILTSLANRGLNLWRVEHGFLGLTPGVNRYLLPSSTIKVPNINFVNNDVITGVLSAIAGGYQFDTTTAVLSARVGFKPTTTFAAAIDILSSTDGVIFTSQLPQSSKTYVADTWYWFDLPVYETIQGIQVTSADPMVLTELAVSSKTYIIPMYQWNRDDYSQQPQRNQIGRPSTNFYFDRQIDSQVWIWPNVQREHDHLEFWLHRLIEDIDLLTEEIDVPTQWVNATTWLLAEELCYVVPGVDPTTIQMVSAKAAMIMQDAELGDGDGSTTTIAPNIAPYTR